MATGILRFKRGNSIQRSRTIVTSNKQVCLWRQLCFSLPNPPPFVAYLCKAEEDVHMYLGRGSPRSRPFTPIGTMGDDSGCWHPRGKPRETLSLPGTLTHALRNLVSGWLTVPQPTWPVTAHRLQPPPSVVAALLPRRVRPTGPPLTVRYGHNPSRLVKQGMGGWVSKS